MLAGAARWAAAIADHPANRGRRASALARAIAWQGWKRLGGTIDLKLGGGVSLRCHPDSRSAARMIYCRNRPDYDEMIFMQRYLRPGDSFIDVGANVGVYTLLAAAMVGSSGHIDAFEPLPGALARLRENVARNRLANVTVHAAATGAEPGRATLLPGGDDTVGRLGNAGETAVIEVECVRLDDAINRPCAMGKMDIEGAEPLAFAGAARLLADHNPPVWLIEINGALRAFGWTEAGFRDRLEGAGYRLALYDADTFRLRPAEEPWHERDNCLAIADMALVERRLGHGA